MLAQDIAGVSPAALRAELGLARGELALLTACPPCQGFSTLGKMDRGDARNGLVGAPWRFVREFLPEAVLIENVPGARASALWSDLERRLAAAGYRRRSWIVDAADFGVPQRRRRLIAIALRGDVPGTLPGDLRAALPPDFPLAAADASAAIAEAGPIEGTRDEWHRARSSSPLTLERIRAVPPGSGRSALPERLQLALPQAAAAARPDGRDRPLRTHSDGRSAPTMTTRCTTVSCGRFIHPTEDRGISLREAALLQTFPADYRFAGSHEAAERQIGNALPVKLAHALGLVVRASIGRI